MQRTNSSPSLHIVGAIGVHAGAGAWGLVSIGLFADSELIGIDVMSGLFRGGGFELLGCQLLAIISTVGWAVLWSTCFFYLVGTALSGDLKDPREGLRVDAKEEECGADWYLHGVVDRQTCVAESLADDCSFSDEDSLANEKLSPRLTRTGLYRRTSKLTESDEFDEDIENGRLSEHKEPDEHDEPKHEECGEVEIPAGDIFHSAHSSSEHEHDASLVEYSERARHTHSRRLYNARTPMGLPRQSQRRQRGALGHSMTSTNSNVRKEMLRTIRRASGERNIQFYR